MGNFGCQPEKNYSKIHGGQSRSWSAEQGKENILFFPSPPIRPGEAFWSVIFSSLSLLLFVFGDVAMVRKGKPASVTTGKRDRTYVRK